MTASRRVVAVVLAAGSATRFGGDKLLYPLNGLPLGEHIAVTLGGMAVTRLAVCPVESARRALFERHGFEIIDNPRPEQGMGTSLALGAAWAMALDADALLVCLADMPFVTEEHLQALLAVESDAVVTEAEGGRSPPAVFGRELLPELAKLTGDQGARGLLKSAVVVRAAAELVRDFDTPHDFI